MARVDRRCSWDVRGDEDSLRRVLLRFFRGHKMKVVGEDEGEFHTLHAKQGSQLWTRLVGGWFVSAATLPKQAHATFTRSREGLRLRVTIEESLGFGIMDPLLKSKYEDYFEEWLDDLEAVLDLVPEDDEPEPPRKKRRGRSSPDEGVTRPDDRLAGPD